MLNRTTLASVFALCSLTTLAQAQLMGNALDASWRFPSLGTVLETHLVTVGQGIELPNTAIVSDFKFDIDIGDDWVEFRFNAGSNWSANPFNGWHFADSAGTLGPVLGYDLDSTSAGVSNIGLIQTGFNDDEFWANFAGVSIAGPGEWIRLKVTLGGTGTSFCSGDGIESPCPCGNLGATGEGCANSTTQGAILGASGTGVATSDDLVLEGSQLPPGVTALFFSGTTTIAPASFFGDGLRCAGGQITRLEVAVVDASGNASTSVGIASTLGASTGTQSVFQVWYRDPSSLCGSGFNTSNALDLLWQ